MTVVSDDSFAGLEINSNSNDAVDQLKERISAVALYVMGDADQSIINQNSTWSLASIAAQSVPIGKVIKSPGGVAHALVGDSRVILLPRIANNEQSHLVYADLLQCFNREASGIKWIVDCSTLTELPILLLSNLIAYTHKLRSKNSDLFLAWFKPEFIPDKQRDKISDFFHLKLVGGYLFSTLY